MIWMAARRAQKVKADPDVILNVGFIALIGGVALVIGGLVALAIAWATVGGNAARVATRNPVEALRYE